MPARKKARARASRRRKLPARKVRRVSRQLVASTRKRNQSSKLSISKGKAERARGSKKKISRSYSAATLGKLWGLSGNQCAFPGCSNELIAQGTAAPEKAIVGNICHIYAASDDGPRGKPGLTTKERNAFENLILMCGHHHPRVDKLYHDYPAGELLKWKRDHEAKALQNTPENLRRQADIQKLVFFQQTSDAQIERSLDRLIKARALNGFLVLDEAEALATQVEQSKFSSGSDHVRARALAWCARIISWKNPARATALLTFSRKLVSTPDAILAEAFILSKSDKAAALAILKKQNSMRAMTAALRIETNASGPEAAIKWANAAGLSIESFDADGKSTYIVNALQAGDWQIAVAASAKINDADYQEFPLLMHAVALTKLASATPPELRKSVITHVPFEARDFPLGSEGDQLAARRAARFLFGKFSAFAKEMEAVAASNLAFDYALWLGLRDPASNGEALSELRESMRDPTTSLRLLNFALQFGIAIDLRGFEQRIDQSVALTGKGTLDDALARLSLAFAQGNHRPRYTRSRYCFKRTGEGHRC
jgi:hypothetical protein